MKIHYGFSSFRRGQENAIDAILAGRSAVVIMPTGGGKSLCYQLPALVLSGLTVVVSPLIALMKDQVDRLQQRGIAATFINSSLGETATTARLEELKNDRYRLVYIAPERFANQAFVASLRELSIGLLAIDEAHCISQWGHDFRPSYGRLKAARELLGNPPVIALTATATPEVRDDIIRQLGLNDYQLVITGFARPNLQFGIINASDSQKSQIIVDAIASLNEPIGIIYAGTRARTENILQTLLDRGLDAVGYHAGLDAAAREQVQNDFMSGRSPIIVATNAFGMGVDKSDIRFVIHDQMPGTIESYYQEAGRAGRDQALSLCLILYHPRDRYLREFFIRGDNPEPPLILKIYKMLTEWPTEPQGSLLITYADLKTRLADDVPDMAIGTALKILETAGYLRRSRERLGNAYLRLLTDAAQAGLTLGAKAKSRQTLCDLLLKRYGRELIGGWEINLDDLAQMIGVKKSSLSGLIKKLSATGALEYRPPFKGTEIYLTKRVAPEEVTLDFKALSNKRRAAYAKLDAMEDYIYHRGCRQQFILRYFGENDAPPCGHCDFCLNGPGADGHRRDKPAPRIKHRQPAADFNDWTTEVKIESPLTTKLTQLQTFELYNQGLDLTAIAAKRQLAASTVTEHLCYLMEKKLPIDLNRLVKPATQKKILAAIQNLGPSPLKPLKELLGTEISYDEIRLVVADYDRRAAR